MERGGGGKERGVRKGKEEGRGREGKGDCLTPGCEILAPPLPLATPTPQW